MLIRKCELFTLMISRPGFGTRQTGHAPVSKIYQSSIDNLSYLL